MKLFTLICAASLAVGLVQARADDAKKDAAGDKKEVAVFKTSMGEMVIELWPDVAPKTVESFKNLARKGFYDGTAFHRIIDGFMIQGGDPKTKDEKLEAEWGTGGPGYNVPDEFNDKAHVRGVLSMAHSGAPNSGGSQFFICLGDAPFLNHHYTAFGKLIKGDDVLTKLGKVEVKPNPYDPRHEKSRPVERVTLESVKIVPADSFH